MVDTKGRRLLVKRLRPKGPHTQLWLASILEIGQSSVSHWVRGVSRPEAHHRLALRALLHIPSRTWMTPEEAELVERAAEVARSVEAPKAA